MGLFFNQLNPGVTTWGVANPDGTVTASASEEDARIDSGIRGQSPVYHHPDGRWVNAGTGATLPPP